MRAASAFAMWVFSSIKRRSTSPPVTSVTAIAEGGRDVLAQESKGFRAVLEREGGSGGVEVDQCGDGQATVQRPLGLVLGGHGFDALVAARTGLPKGRTVVDRARRRAAFCAMGGEGARIGLIEHVSGFHWRCASDQGGS
jgi:hypothetical protein